MALDRVGKCVDPDDFTPRPEACRPALQVGSHAISDQYHGRSEALGRMGRYASHGDALFADLSHRLGLSEALRFSEFANSLVHYFATLFGGTRRSGSVFSDVISSLALASSWSFTGFRTCGSGDDLVGRGFKITAFSNECAT